MIIKKKILSNEIIKKKRNNINYKDIKLFSNDFVNKTGESYSYYMKDVNILNDGKIFTFNYDVISDYLSFNSLSKFVFVKKIILYLNYIFKIILEQIFKQNKNIKFNCIIVHNRNSIGYFHWLIDTLPKIIYAKKKYKNFTIILPEELKKDFILKSLKKFNIKIFFLKKKYNYSFKKLIYIGNLYPSGNPRKTIINDMKNLVNSQSNGKNRVYISRNRSNRRKITNEKDLINILKKYKFKILYSEKIPFENQIKIFSNTKYMLGLHGAGLSNLIWMKKKSYLIEIKPEMDLYLNCYFNLASLLNLNYHYLVCKKKSIFVSSKNSNYEVDLNKLKKKLDKIFK